MIRKNVRTLGFLIAATAASATCARSPLQPTPPAFEIRLVPVIVTVRQYATQDSPIPGATAMVNGGNAYQERAGTGNDGIATVQAPAGLEVRIDASADGYRSFGAAGIVNTPGERWTFYLEAE